MNEEERSRMIKIQSKSLFCVGIEGGGEGNA